MNVGAVMDELAARIRQAPSLAGRTYAWPPGTVTPPAAIVPYPDRIDFDQTYGRGVDRMTGSFVIVVGRPTDRQTRDQLTKYVDGIGAESMKVLVDGGVYTSCDSVSITAAEFDVVTIGSTDYLAAIFGIDIIGPGA